MGNQKTWEEDWLQRQITPHLLWPNSELFCPTNPSCAISAEDNPASLGTQGLRDGASARYLFPFFLSFLLLCGPVCMLSPPQINGIKAKDAWLWWGVCCWPWRMVISSSEGVDSEKSLRPDLSWADRVSKRHPLPCLFRFAVGATKQKRKDWTPSDREFEGRKRRDKMRGGTSQG